MAPRKKKKSEEAQTPRNVLKVKDAGVKRRTRSSGLPPEYTGLEQLPKIPEVKVKLHKNLLVDLTETPPDLFEKAQRNATESPLLRLPREIRSIIWTYAVQVDLVRIQSKRQGPQRVTGCAVALNAGRTHITGDRQRSAFHLPEVCRQVYAETATLAYSTNTFLLSPSGSGWIRTLSLTQRRAITRVELSSYLPEYLAGYQLRSFGGVPKLCVLQGSGMASLRSKGLVGVTHCAVSIEAQELIKTDPFLRFHEDRKSWVRFITTVVQRIEGQHMVVEVQ